MVTNTHKHKASMCTKAEVDWTKVDSDHAGVQIWLDICKKAPRGPILFNVMEV